MNQKEFSDYVIEKLIAHFPESKKFCVPKLNDILNIEYMSPFNNVELWITTQDKEITIGLEGNSKLKDWHTHVTSYDLELIDNDIKDAIKIIEKIVNDKKDIVHSNITGYSLFSQVDNAPLQNGEQIEIKRWSEW